MNGRPEAEVIVNVSLYNLIRYCSKRRFQFQDGLSYNKKRLEEAFASGAFDTPSKKSKETIHISDAKKEHVELIVGFLCARFVVLS